MMSHSGIARGVVHSPIVTRLLNLDQWAGRWVAVTAAGAVVAHAETMEALYAALEHDGVVDVEIMKALEPRQSVAYGLG